MGLGGKATRMNQGSVCMEEDIEFVESGAPSLHSETGSCLLLNLWAGAGILELLLFG